MTASFLAASVSLYKFSNSSPVLHVFQAVLALNIVASCASMLSGLNKRKVSRASHERLVGSWAPATLPTVDVFLPTCGEPLEVLRNTYDHVAALYWPGSLMVWVLDDADRPEVRDLAQEFGFEYRVRPDRGRMKKSGNLAYGLSVSAGEWIAIFDADFCPRHDYLFHLMPYGDDPEVGIVQSPQYFDTSASMSWLQRTAGATQELFYRWVQPSRDRAGAPICVGTCALYRRSALESVGGFAQIEHSEDVHTGIFLLRGGFSTRYVPAVISKGLCPDDLAGFLNQQYRWCNGSITLLRSGHAQKRPLSIRQRVCFWAGFFYYITTAVNVFTVHLPGIIMAFFFPQDVFAKNYLPFIAGAWVYMVLLPTVSRSKWRFEVMRVQMAYSFCHAVAIVHKIFGRSAGWVATGAVGKKNSLARTISITGFTTIVAGLGLQVAGLLYAIPRFGLAQFWPMVLFTLAWAYLAVPLARDFWPIVAPASLTHGRRARSSRGVQSVRIDLRGEPSLGVLLRGAADHALSGRPGEDGDRYVDLAGLERALGVSLPDVGSGRAR